MTISPKNSKHTPPLPQLLLLPSPPINHHSQHSHAPCTIRTVLGAAVSWVCFSLLLISSFSWIEWSVLSLLLQNMEHFCNPCTCEAAFRMILSSKPAWSTKVPGQWEEGKRERKRESEITSCFLSRARLLYHLFTLGLVSCPSWICSSSHETCTHPRTLVSVMELFLRLNVRAGIYED